MTRLACPLAAVLGLFVSAAAAQTTSDTRDLTPLLAEGLDASRATLEAEAPSPARDFALGGVRFLQAVEDTLQLRYRHNADFGDLDLPVLRLPLPPNPEAAPFYPALVSDLMRGVVADMQTARATLEIEQAFGVTVDLAAVWFDINENGTRDRGEDLLAAAGAAFGPAGPATAPGALVIRFDRADAAWLRAYTHLLEGFGHLVLAFDPTEVIDEVTTATARISALRGPEASARTFFSAEDEIIVDNVAVIYGALNRPPDATHIAAARDSLLAMIADNRLFWERVTEETDNAAEWIPAPGQTSALGVELPAETGARWQAVLADAEDILLGRQLVGHWRMRGQGGVNFARLLQDPRPVDIVTWIQGHGLIDVMEAGPVANPSNLNRFYDMFRGQALLFMVWLN